MDETKRCNQCYEDLPLYKFSKRKFKTKAGISETEQPYCKSCRVAYNWKSAIKSKYGLTVEQYSSMLEVQQGLCAICLKPPLEGRKLDIDHCHITNKVRGLLCVNCNVGIGKLGDNVEGVQAALRYLKEREDDDPDK